MNKRELELAAKLLNLASDKFSNHGCNDFTLPESWTQEECDEFLLAAHTWNGDPKGHRPGDRMSMDWFVMDYLAAKLRIASESSANSELLAAAKSFIALFRDSDMRPEDECHDLFHQMLMAVENATGNMP